MTRFRRYSELIQYFTFEERFDYLKLEGAIGYATFGFDRYLNQQFYQSREWQDIRDFVLLRDNGCDLGIEGYEINISPLIHHINPMTVDDIMHKEDWILDPEFLITTSHKTHNALHYGGNINAPKVVIQRSPDDTKLW